MAAMRKFVPSKLSSFCIRKIVETIDMHTDNLEIQPFEIKDKVLYLMSKRGAVTDNNIGKILHPGVIDLDLSESELSDEGLIEVCKCTRLRKLDLNAGKGSRKWISSGGVKCVAECCRNLEVVYLRRCELVDDLAVSDLAQNCRNLSQLNLEGCTSVTDLAMRSIAENLPKLRSLNVSRTQVTDHGLEFLANGPCANTIFELHVSNCSYVTDDGIELLVNSCPGLKILIFHGCPLTTDRSRECIEVLGRNMRQLSWSVY